MAPFEGVVGPRVNPTGRRRDFKVEQRYSIEGGSFRGGKKCLHKIGG